MLLPTLILALRLPIQSELPVTPPVVIRLPDAATPARSPYDVRPGEGKTYMSPYLPVAPPMPSAAVVSPYATIHYPPESAAPLERLPAPQILDTPPRWLPGARPSKSPSPPAPNTPKLMPLIPLDQLPDGPGCMAQPEYQAITLCRWQ